MDKFNSQQCFYAETAFAFLPVCHAGFAHRQGKEAVVGINKNKNWLQYIFLSCEFLKLLEASRADLACCTVYVLYIGETTLPMIGIDRFRSVHVNVATDEHRHKRLIKGPARPGPRVVVGNIGGSGRESKLYSEPALNNPCTMFSGFLIECHVFKSLRTSQAL